MGNKLYLECYSGISGDMTVAALLDLGANQKVLETALQSLPLEHYQIRITRVLKSGLDACDFDVILDDTYENHDHDMEYLHGTHHHEHTLEHHHTHGDDHTHPHTHKKHSDHDHDHKQEEGHHHHHTHTHEHRNLSDCYHIIDHGNLTSGANKIAKKIFRVLAEGEAKAHGKSLEDVHFHEVGAIDSIVDIVSVAVCIDNLGIEEVIVPFLYEGYGTIQCAHGVMPVPVPATANIINQYQIPLRRIDIEGEFVTPTGAAICGALCTSQSLPETYKIQKVGIGAGKRSYNRPSFVRAYLIEERLSKQDETKILKLEANIDDSTGEMIGYAMELLLEAGARDVYLTPIQMKKNRPGIVLSVICMPEDQEKMEKIIFQHTTTIGIRRQKLDRTVLNRYQEDLSTKWGTIRIKVIESDFGIRKEPEYESLRTIAEKFGLSILEIKQEIYHLL